MNGQHTTPLAPLLQQFFVERLQQQRQASPRTIGAYRDAFRLLLSYAQEKTHRPPAALAIEDFDTALILGFLEHLERQRKNSARSRNARFAAIRSFMHYISFKEPATLDLARRVLTIPMKRFDRRQVGFLTRDQVQAIVNAPDATRWAGRRDRVLFATLYNTGARVSELVGIRGEDLALGQGAAVRLHGKGRKDRIVPLWPTTASQLRQWLRTQPNTRNGPVFQNRSGDALSRTTVSERLQLAVHAATAHHPELKRQRVSPHVFRHSIAMHLLQAGVDITVIALWLGHQCTSTTHMYVEADLTMKERSLRSLQAPGPRSLRYRPPDQLLQFLQSL